MTRSSAYWAQNLYLDANEEPKPRAPYRDLASVPAGRFRVLREGLLAIDGAAEHVRFMGARWGWAWEYSIGSRKLCWLHLLQSGVSATFTLSQFEERSVAASKLAHTIRDAIREGQRTGPVRWCSIEFTERKMAEAFLGFARRKAGWLATEAASPSPTRRSQAG